MGLGACELGHQWFYLDLVVPGRKLPPDLVGVKTEEIRKGRIWAGLRDIWRAFLEIIPLQKSKEKRGKSKKTFEKQTKCKTAFIFL